VCVGRNSVEPAVDYLLDAAYDEYPNETSWSLTTGAVVAASGFDEVTASVFFFLSESVGFVPGDEYQLVILDSVGDGM
jgi:hypothetical protein